jgi:putative ABC transport system permease protein
MIAIFIACLGLFGLVSYSAERRTKEIGIRKVLGAQISDITWLMSKEFLFLVFTANIVAWPVAYYFMNKWLQNFAYRINIGLGVFIASGTIALVIAIITASFQSIKAATANPADSLRYE